MKENDLKEVYCWKNLNQTKSQLYCLIKHPQKLTVKFKNQNFHGWIKFSIKMLLNQIFIPDYPYSFPFEEESFKNHKIMIKIMEFIDFNLNKNFQH